MQYVIIGKGKTGKAVQAAIPVKECLAVYDSKTPIDSAILKQATCAIIFIPAQGLESILEILVESKVPVICGTTGFEFPTRFSERLQKQGTSWIHGNNFSIGANWLFSLSKYLKQYLIKTGMPPVNHILEVHHIDKKDTPSGTARYLQKIWEPEFSTPIHSIREADVKGTAELTIEIPNEIFTLKHTASSRNAFAQGALWAATHFLPHLNGGLYHFEELFYESNPLDSAHHSLQ